MKQSEQTPTSNFHSRMVLLDIITILLPTEG